MPVIGIANSASDLNPCNLPLGDLAVQVKAGIEEVCVVICPGDQPAYHAAAVAAKKLGYTNIKHLVAGIQGWKSAGEKIEKGT